MSLLMQALKKAENAKQRQGEPSDVLLTEPQETSPAGGVESLTLQPQEPSGFESPATDSAPPAGLQPAAVRTEPHDYFSGAAAAHFESPFATGAQHPLQGADPVFASKPRNETFDSTNEFSAGMRQAPPPAAKREESLGPGGGTHNKLKIGLDLKQSAAIETKKKLAARNAAKSVFASKQKSPNRRAIVIAGVGLIVLAAGGAYGYFNIMGITHTLPLTMVAAAPQPSATPTLGVVAPDSAAVLAEPMPATDVVSAVSAAAPATSRSKSTPDIKPAVAPALDTAPAPPASLQFSADPPPAPPSRQLPSAQPPLATMAAQSQAIQIRRTNASLQLNPALSGAYQAYVSGDIASAQTQYQRVLQQEPNNRDALLGIAAIAVNRGQNAQAGSFYNRLLELDPNDVEASAGIASLQRSDPAQAESRLKKILAQNPNTGSALFALGNVYAQQSRWAEAQQFYFRAFGATPGDADYAYNLAVSLDKLNQGRLALDYYQRSLQLAQKNGGNLNKAAVSNRILELQSSMQASATE